MVFFAFTITVVGGSNYAGGVRLLNDIDVFCQVGSRVRIGATGEDRD